MFCTWVPNAAENPVLHRSSRISRAFAVFDFSVPPKSRRFVMTLSSPTIAPVLVDPRTRTQIVVAVMLGLFLAALDQTIVGTALPCFVNDPRATEIYTWAFTAYLLTATISGPIYGKLSDLF